MTKEELRYKLIELREEYPKKWTCNNIYRSIHKDIILHTKILNKFDDNKMIERSYFILNYLEDRPLCKICNDYVKYSQEGNYHIYCSGKCSSKDCTEIREETYFKKTGYTNPLKNPEVQNKIKQTNLDRYGVENVYQSEVIKDKSKQTKLERYDDPYYNNQEKIKETRSSWSEEKKHKIKDKSKQTKLERYDDPNYVNSSKASETYFKRTGYHHQFHNPEVKQKKIETSNKNYGTDYPNQNREQFEKVLKSLYSTKEYIFPSGRIEYVQGYEPQALDELLNHFEEDDILVGFKIPSFEYLINNKKHVYHPDIYVKSRNMIVEVKSTHTLATDLNKNLAKRQACIDAGYNFWFSVGTF